MQAIDISSRRMHRRREPLSGSTHEKGKYSHPRLSFTKYGRDVFSFRQSRAKLWPLTNKNRTLKLIEQFSTVKLSTLQSKFLQRKSPFHRSFFLRPKQFLFFFFSTSLFSCNTLNASLYNFVFSLLTSPFSKSQLFSFLFIFYDIYRFSISLIFLGLVSCFPGVVLRLFLFWSVSESS